MLALALCTVGTLQLSAQSINLDMTTNDSTFSGLGSGLTICDDGGPSGNYQPGYDYHLSVVSSCSDMIDSSTMSEYAMYVEVGEVDLAAGDTLYIYDGSSSRSPLLVKFSRDWQSRPGTIFYISSSNTSGTVTIRMYSRNSGGEKPAGFRLMLGCRVPCEFIHPVIDSAYEHISMETGQVVTRRKMQAFPDIIDTIYLTDTIQVFDTVWNDSTHTTGYRLTNPTSWATTPCRTSPA